MMQSRTHNCGELRAQHAGEHVKLVGWMENVRVVGNNFAFIVLRDFYGTTQIVVETEEIMNIVKGINKESTISVTGTVRERASKNPKQPTGDIEVVPEKIELLGRCQYNELPFEINRSRDADETQRLKYRYLDLRNPAVKSNIILRCNVIAAIRKAMMDHDFLEITTPILTASSPEGARDYLVPARKHPGKFYALPQAPQQFKQLLMTSGFDRYFQIAPCFRDEDARGDRSPGEFYQLDMEMAFATQEDVFAVLEDVLPPIFAKFGTYNVASSAPFRRIAYRDAMETYGSDKPDLRIDLTCKNVTSLFTESEFDALRGQTVKMVPVSNCKLTRKQIDKLLADCEVQSGSKAYWFKADENGQLAGGIAKFVTGLQQELTETLDLKPNTLVLVAAGLMWYNYARFGSLFDFGANYNLTGNDMTQRGFNAVRIGPAVFTSLFELPSWQGVFPFLRETDVQTNAVIRTISEKFTGGILAATPYLWVLALPLLPAFRHCLHRRRVTACVVYGSLAAMVVMTVVDCEMAGVLYRYLMDYSPVLLLGAALCWFCAEGALSRRAALGEGTAAAALPALRTVMAAAVAYTAVYRFCTLFAMEPWLQGMNPSLYYTVSRLVQFWM